MNGSSIRDVSGIGISLVSPLLLGYGLAGIAGNFVAGHSITRRPRRTLLAIVLGLTAVTGLFPLAGTTPTTGVVLLLAWGLAFGGVSVSLQTWVLAAAPDTGEAATALWVSMFNLSIALGALLGGRTVDVASLPATLWLASGLVLAAGLTLWLGRQSLADART